MDQARRDEPADTDPHPERDKYAPKRVPDWRERMFRCSGFRFEAAAPLWPGESDADISSVLLAAVIEQFQWLGNVAHCAVTSKFDIYARQIDSTVHLTNEAHIPPLGFECCLCPSENDIALEIRAVVQDIEGGQEFAVKYFDSPITGRRINVQMPRVLFAWAFDDARSLLLLVSRALHGERAELVRQLGDHPLRRQFIARTVLQLEEYLKAATSAGNTEYARMHEVLLRLVKSRA